MNFSDLTNPSGDTNKGACVYPIKDARGKTVMCGEITLLDENGNHYAFCSEHRKMVEARYREIWSKKKARMSAGRKKEITPFNQMKISKLVMR